MTLRDSPPHSADLRKGRHSVPGQVYLVTFTTAGRRPLFAEPDCAMAVARAIADQRLWTDAKLLAWVLMPDHWHGLVELGQRDSLSRIVQRLKTNTSRTVGDALQAMPVWCKGFHDRALRQDEAVRDAARYLVMNPVRAELVRRVGEYPYWDAVWVGGG